MALFQVFDASATGYNMFRILAQPTSTVAAETNEFTYANALGQQSRFLTAANDITYSGAPGAETPTDGTFYRIDLLTGAGATGAALTGFGTQNIGSYFNHTIRYDTLLAGDDVIIGGNGADLLFGRAGADTILGGAGGDNVYFYSMDNNTGASADGGTGTDLLYAFGPVDFTGITLNSFEYLSLQSDDGSGVGGATFLANQIGSGLAANAFISSNDTHDVLNFEMFDRNALDISGFNFAGWGANDQICIRGDVSSETITGSAQADWILSGAGNDTLNGGAGNDILNGGTGVDVMRGGLGNDSYFADVGGDTIVELAGQGTADKVTSATIGLNLNTLGGGQIENAQLTGSAALNILGNASANALFGNAGGNTISGGGGNDFIYAGSGNDTLLGGAGADSFVFNTALNAATNRDTISDFTSIDDTIRLENTGSGMFNGLAVGQLSATAFWSAAGAVTGHDTSDRIVYNSTTGDLYYDADGNGAGAAVKFATLTGHPVLTNADFIVF